MRIKAFLNNRFVRLIGLLAVLSITVLAALWQQTSASSNEVPALDMPHRSATPTPSSIPTPTPAVTSSGFVVPDPSSLTVVINKRRALPLTYKPANLVVPHVPLRYEASAEQSYLRAEAAIALEQLFAGASHDSISLEFISGYRSASYQTIIYDNALRANTRIIADEAVARPGHSEHQTGLALDLGRPDRMCDIEACFGSTPEGQWIQANAAEYGFILSYSAAKHNLAGYEYEPWHLRYVGRTLAGQLKVSSQTLEEYFGLPFAPTY